MSEPRDPKKDGGLKQPPQTSPAPDFGTTKTGGGETRGDGHEDRDGGGMIGEGETGGRRGGMAGEG